jgi:hypothetical protein
MTEKERFIPMLTRARVVWSESVWKVHVDEVPTPGATTGYFMVLLNIGTSSREMEYKPPSDM